MQFSVLLLFFAFFITSCQKYSVFWLYPTTMKVYHIDNLFLFFLMIFSYHQQQLFSAAETVCAIAGTWWKALFLEKKHNKTHHHLLFKFSRWSSFRVHYIMNVKDHEKFFSSLILGWNIVSLHSFLDITSYLSSLRLEFSILQYCLKKGFHL